MLGNRKKKTIGIFDRGKKRKKQDVVIESTDIMNRLETYRDTGNYVELNNIIRQGFLSENGLAQVHAGLVCLWQTDYAWMKNHVEEIKADMENMSGTWHMDKESGELFYQICSMVAELLVGVGVAINQIAIYKELMSNVAEKIECDENIVSERNLYEKCCIMLSLAHHIKGFRFVEKDCSLEECTLSDLTWDYKLKEFQKMDYQKKVSQLIVRLLDPKVHSYVDEKRCVIGILSLCTHIQPGLRTELISNYRDIVKDTYLSGYDKMIMHVNQAYGEILGTGQDSYELSKYFEAFVKDSPEIHKFEKEHSVINKLSEKAYKAWEKAEHFRKSICAAGTEKGNFSVLILQYFSILKIIYAEQFLIPLIKEIHFEQLREKIEMCSNDEHKAMWKTDVSYLMQLQKENQESFEASRIQTILKHIFSEEFQNDECSKYLKSCIKKLLSDAGEGKAEEKDIQNTVYKEMFEAYQFSEGTPENCSFSVACESREYVLKMIPRILL